MNDQSFPSVADERYSALALIRRLLTEQGLTHWRNYAIAFVLMAVAAGCTALPAYLVGDFINQAYLRHSFRMIVVLGIATMIIFIVKGLATYGHMVILSRIGNRIVADNQQRLFN